MALPNPGMDAVPFTPLTAEFLDDMIENIESLSDGTGFQNGAITTNTLAESAVTASKVNWSTLGTKVVKNTANYFVNSATMSDKITGTLDAGTYIAISHAIFGSGSSGASGECNTRVRYGSSYTPGVTYMMPSTPGNYNSAAVIEQAVIVIPADGTVVALQASVNWPARGTFSVAANASSITFIRIA